MPPHADVKNTLDETYTATNSLETKFSEGLFIVTGDFNQTNLKQVMPKYHQRISCPTRGLSVLDRCYTAIKDTYHSIPCPHFGKSDHSAVFLLPAYKQKLKCKEPPQTEVQCWSKAVSPEPLEYQRHGVTCPDSPVTPVATVTAAEVSSVFPRVNPRKMMGLDGVPGRALRSCVDQLVEVFTNIFNLSLLQAKEASRRPPTFQYLRKHMKRALLTIA
eukprot:g35407.t1